VQVSRGRRARDDLANTPKAADRLADASDLFSPEFRARLCSFGPRGFALLLLLSHWLPGFAGRGYHIGKFLLMIGLFNTGRYRSARSARKSIGSVRSGPADGLAGRGAFLSLLDVSINSRPLLLAASYQRLHRGGGGRCLAAMLAALSSGLRKRGRVGTGDRQAGRRTWPDG